MAGDIRDKGFGLNYDRGFGKGREGFMPSFNPADLQGRGFDILGDRARQNALDKELGNQLDLGNIAAEASKFPHILEQQRFDKIFPLIRQGMQQSPFIPVGGQSGPSPEISVGPVWNQNQIQRQVNAARATNDAATQGLMRRTQQQLGGQGFASNSPLLKALQSNQQMQNVAANADAERGIRWDSAEGNAGQLLKTQQARENQFANRQGEDIERRKAANQQQSALLSILAGMV